MSPVSVAGADGKALVVIHRGQPRDDSPDGLSAEPTAAQSDSTPDCRGAENKTRRWQESRGLLPDAGPVQA